MTLIPNIKIACPHITGKVPIDKVVSDYYPLNKREIANLLDTAAKNREDIQTVSEIQVRLDQGIEGMTCPRPITGKIAERLSELDRVFVKEYEKGSSPGTVDRLHRIMTKK